MSKKSVLVRRYENEIAWEFDGDTVEEAINRLRNQEKSIKENYPDVIEVRLVHEGRKWDEGYTVNIVGFAPENDKEKAVRLEKERQEKEQRAEWDRRKYEELKKRFGDS